MSKRVFRMRNIFIVCLALLLGWGVLHQITFIHAAQTASATNHWLYVIDDGMIVVYDIDNNHALVKQIPIPEAGKRGIGVSPNRGLLYVSFCGQNTCNGTHGSLLAYDLVHNTVAWSVNYPFGVDQFAVTPDGSKIYMPHGTDSSDGLTSVLDASNGNVIGSINTGTDGHNTVVSLDGTQVYLAGYVGSNYNYAHVVNPATNQVTLNVGPTINGIRPFTINGQHTLMFTTSSNTCGFQVLSLTTKAPLYTVPFSGSCAWSASTAPSHGISLSPDEKRVYVMDSPLDQLAVYDVSGLPATAPHFVKNVPLGSLNGFESSCQTYCEREGWVLNDLSGRYVYVGDTGDVISTSTLSVVATLPALQNTRQMIEVDWTNGTVSATSTRFGLGRVTGNTPVNPNPTSNGPAFKGPVAKTWYFAEGHIGNGFREYLTVDNPDPANACSVNMQYLYTPRGSTTALTKTVTVSVAAGSRATEPVNQDLGFDAARGSSADVATTVTVNGSTPNCSGVVVERPVYFANYHGMASGTDVVGATQLAQNFYFADVPAGPNVTSYLTILNPNAQSATVTAKYYAGGRQVQSQTLTVPANARGTIPVNAAVSAAHVAAVVTANQNVLIERPSYFINSGGISGAADTIGAQGLANDWLFAEGYTAPGYQEYLTVANVDPANKPAAVTITLKSRTGVTHSYAVTVNAQSQLIWNVNQNDTFAGASPEVSAEVQSTGANIVVQREMYFQYHHTLATGTQLVAGISDVVGQMGPASKSAYTFAEGYANTGYSEWLTIQNPTAKTETIQLSIVNGNTTVYDAQLTVGANSRFTLDIAATVLSHITIPGNTPSFEIAMTVQSINGGGVFVAERPMYWNTTGSGFPTVGGSDIIGFTG